MSIIALFILSVPFSVHSEERPGALEPAPATWFPQREDEDDSVSLNFGFYRQTDGPNHTGGDPNIDNNATVYEALIILDKTISDRDRLNVRFLGDIISSASQSRFHNPMFRALQSNPSGNKRMEFGVGWSRELDDVSFGFNGGFGAEFSNYYSFGGGTYVSKSLFQDNTLMSLRFQGTVDYFEVKLFNGIEPGFDTRQSYTGEFSITQLMTPRMIVNFTYDHIQQLGYLATTYNSVWVNGVEFSEQVPSNRRRDALTGRLKYSLSRENSIEVGYRFYDDSWDITSHTIETRFFQYAWKRRLLLEPNYRYYTQTGAYFYQPTYTSLPEFRTSDPDLGPFTGHILGARISFLEWPLFAKFWKEVNLSFDYYLRNDGLDIYWITFGSQWRF